MRWLVSEEGPIRMVESFRGISVAILACPGSLLVLIPPRLVFVII